MPCARACCDKQNIGVATGMKCNLLSDLALTLLDAKCCFLNLYCILAGSVSAVYYEFQDKVGMGALDLIRHDLAAQLKSKLSNQFVHQLRTVLHMCAVRIALRACIFQQLLLKSSISQFADDAGGVWKWL